MEKPNWGGVDPAFASIAEFDRMRITINETNDYEKRNESKVITATLIASALFLVIGVDLPPTPGGMASAPCKRDIRISCSMGRKYKQMVG